MSEDAELHGFPIADGGDDVARDDLELLVSRFADEVRLGRCPSVERYARDHRELADQIRDLLPLVETLERWKAEREVECCRRNLPDAFSFDRLGSYRIVRELGRGGMGVVFEGAEDRTQRRVAIKLLPWRFVSDIPRRKERFHREAVLIAGLRHQNIVPVYSFGEHEGYCYYVMQLVHGVSLHWVVQRLRESPEAITPEEVLRAGRGEAAAGRADDGIFSRRSGRALARNSWTSFARIGVQVALALEHAHQRGILHNDVKPANLLLDGAGRVVVTDFGAGLPQAERSERDEFPTGTLRYMAPERLAGAGDVRSDVYSLAATLYELVTQTPAFEAADRLQLLDEVLRTQPRPPRRIARRLPQPLEAIVRRGMAKDPGDRYPTAKAFAADLLRFVNGERPEASGPGLLRRMLRWNAGHSATRLPPA